MRPSKRCNHAEIESANKEKTREFFDETYLKCGFKCGEKKK